MQVQEIYLPVCIIYRILYDKSFSSDSIKTGERVLFLW